MAYMGAKAPTLLIDAMLGSLAKRLRWLGYDAAYRNHLSDEKMMQISQHEDRLLVTRDRALAHRRGVNSLLITATTVEEQLQEVIAAIGPSHHAPRCTVCNGVLGTLDREQAASLVPAYVARTQSHFHQCRDCQRVYWPGSHASGLQKWQP